MQIILQKAKKRNAILNIQVWGDTLYFSFRFFFILLNWLKILCIHHKYIQRRLRFWAQVEGEGTLWPVWDPWVSSLSQDLGKTVLAWLCPKQQSEILLNCASLEKYVSFLCHSRSWAGFGDLPRPLGGEELLTLEAEHGIMSPACWEQHTSCLLWKPEWTVAWCMSSLKRFQGTGGLTGALKLVCGCVSAQRTSVKGFTNLIFVRGSGVQEELEGALWVNRI